MQLNDRPFVVRIDCARRRARSPPASCEWTRSSRSRSPTTAPCACAAGDVASLQRSLPAIARELDVRLSRVEPLDDSLESVFEYLATGTGR